MTGREKIFAALSPDGSAETPVVICYPGIFERDHLGELTDLPWWRLHETDPERRAAFHASLIRATDLDWYELRGGHAGAEQAAVTISEEADGVYQRDARTGERRKLEPPVVGGTLTTARGDAPPITDLEAFLAERVPPPAPFRGVPTGCERLPALLKAALPDKYAFTWAGAPLWLLAGTLGYAEWFAGLADDPAPLLRAADRLLDGQLHGIAAAQALGADGIWIEDCLTDQIGPDRYRRYHLPHLRALTDAIRAAGLHSIHYFCGNPWPVFDLLLESGADALGLEESKKGFAIDIAAVAARVNGRMTLLGNLDAIDLLEHGTDAALRAEIARQRAAGRRNGHRFIQSLGSPVTPGTSVARVRAYAAMAREG
ncbi:MAG TPA: uroporphyrinogen decarboxylase family protein [Armatimonadota bacterium]|nr:uroporphyrinogen decarboxylase family protein [Armatimonadota bacterium]HOS44046.1 uroporphyrinogen decarboxylase family protein [Armatimonadota bacterium]